jgi:hypothetical protein
MSEKSAAKIDFAHFACSLAQGAHTQVELTWIEKRYEQWLRFGRSVSSRIINRRTRIETFRPDAVFALIRWSANDYGTVFSRIDIVRAVALGDPYTTLPFVRPGGDLLLSLSGWPKVEQVLRAIDAVETAGVDPCDAAPDHWRHIANRLAIGARPRPYTVARHEAWLKRKALGQ